MREEEKVFQKRDLVKQLMVSKRNDMIQNSRQNLSLREQKAVLYMLTKVKPDDKPGKEYEFSALEFAIAIGIKGKARYNYKVVLDMLQKLSDKSWWIKSSTGDGHDLVRWFNTVHIREDKTGPGKLKIKFHEDMEPYIYNLVEQKKKDKLSFSTYGFSYTIPMKNKYSPRLWEVLKTYEFNNASWYFYIEDLQSLLAPTDDDGNPEIPSSWNPFSKFQKKVLEPAVEEINKFTDITISYATSSRDSYGRKYRGVKTITFFMEKKTEMELADTDDRIMEELYDADERQVIQKEFDNYNQTFNQFKEERKQAEQLEFYEKLDERINNSEYPIIVSEYPEFSDKEIKALYTASQRFIPKTLDITFYELWVVEYIKIYYDEIMAMGNTNTSMFNRLYAALLKDYRNIANTISVP